MADAEAVVRDRVDRDLDCADSALRQIDLRQAMTRLIGEWRSAGGGDLLPGLGERMGLRPAKKDSKPVRVVLRR